MTHNEIEQSPHLTDYVARTMAREAMISLDSHEKICTERWEQSRKSLTAVDKNIDRLFSHMWAAAISIITLLLTSLFYILSHNIHFGAQ